MQQQGMQDTEISQKLQEQGNNPKEIDDAINQSKIKAAVSEGGYEENGQDAVMGNAPSASMQPSITDQPSPDVSQQQAPSAEYTPVQEYMPQPSSQEYSYSPQEYYQPQQQGISPDTVSEIADQIVSEKTSEMKKALSLLANFKTLSEAKVSALDSRLKRIESAIEKLQDSIIGKIGEYGQAFQDIKSEMTGMEEAFSKVINPLVEKGRQAARETGYVQVPDEIKEELPEQQQVQQVQQQVQKKPKQKSKPKLQEDEQMQRSIMSDSQDEKEQPRKKRSDGFENYLR